MKKIGQRFETRQDSTQLTVLMPVFNAAAFVAEAIESILRQTYSDFNFLIIDDDSKDNSVEIINSFSDGRITLLTLPRSRGMATALNRGLDLLKTPLVARMDADDISMPKRLERQVAFMNSHPEVGICGTQAEVFNGTRRWLIKHPKAAADVRAKLLFESALAHPTVVMRTELLNRFSLRYDEQMGLSEDWDLWVRASECFELANLQEVQLLYRLHERSLSARNIEPQREVDRTLHTRFLRPLGLSDHPLKRVHSDVSMSTLNITDRCETFLLQVKEWFDLLQEANGKIGIYDPEALRRFLKRRLLFVLQLNAHHRKRAFKLFIKERLYLYGGNLDLLSFLTKCLFGG